LCGQRFNRRRRPIELGVSNRVTSRMGALEHAMLERRSHTTHVSTGEPAPRDMPSLVEPERSEIDLTDGRAIDLTADAAPDAPATAAEDAESTTGAGAQPPER
jgi:hypothetical protein